MIGTAPLVIRQVGLIDRSHVHAKPLQAKWPRMRHDGDGNFTPHFPAEINNDGCAANDHLTYNKIHDWYVCTGEFDPYSLYEGVLKRLISNNTQVCQDLTSSGIVVGEHYRVSLSGSGTISFGGTNTVCTWMYAAAGNTGNSIRLEDGTADITFGVAPPDTIAIKLDNNSDEVYSISMLDVHENPAVEMLQNTTFNEIGTYFYDIEGWYEDTKDTDLVPTNVLGWLEGFNDSQIYTVFE